MAKQQDNLIFVSNLSGRHTRLGSTNSIAITKDLEIGGNLTVLGTMTYVDSEILTSDNYLFMNGEYTGSTTSKGGLILNASIDNLKRGSLNSITASTRTIIIGSHTSFDEGDIVAVVGSTDKLNDGLYEVAQSSSNPDNSSTAIVVKSALKSGFEDMFKVSLLDESNTSGCIVGLCNISVIRSDSSAGTFETGFGSNTTGGTNLISFNDLAGAGGASLQTAYGVSNSISMTASDGSLTVSPSGTTGSEEVAGFSISGNTASTVQTLNANALNLKTNSGELNIESSAGNVNVKTANTQDIKLLTGTSESSNTDVFGRLLLDGNVVSLRANGSAGTCNVSSEGTLSLISDTGAVIANSSAGNMFLTATGGNNALSAVGSSADVSISAGDNLTIDSGAHASSTGRNMTLTSTGGKLALVTTLASTERDDIGLTSAKDITLLASDAISLTASDGAVNISATTGSNNTGSVSITAGHDLTATSNTTAIFGNATQNQITKITTLGTGTPFGTGTSKLQLLTDELTAEAQSFFSIESEGSSASNVIRASGNNSTIEVNSTGDLTLETDAQLIAQGDSLYLKATKTGSGELLQFVDSGANEIVALNDERIRTKRTLLLGEDVLHNGALISGTGTAKTVGVGINVTAEAGVEIGNILAVTSSAQFGLAGTTRTSSESELKQNPLGVAMGNGSTGATATVAMNTVFGAVSLIQMAGSVSSTDVGLPVYLSATAGKGSTVFPTGNGDGLTRVTQIGTLLSHNGSSVTGLSGSITLYPVLWNVDYVVDR